MTDTTLDLDSIPFKDWPFSAKVQFWKRNGAPGVTYQGGQQQFHDITIKQYADREVGMAAAKGRTIVPVDANGDWA